MMRTYKHKGIRVIESNFLLSFNKSARGAALGWVILHKIPKHLHHRVAGSVAPYKTDYEICSDNGCKPLDAILRHEATHIDRQQEYGVLKWMYKYFTDKEFHDNEERIAREAE